MTVKEFINSWSMGLDDYINRQARKFSRRPEDQEDYRSEAYLYLSVARAGLTAEELRRIAYNAMINLHRKYRKDVYVSFETWFNYCHT